MSVTIKGLDIPVNCFRCNLIGVIDCPMSSIPLSSDRAKPYMEHRHEQCPLIDVDYNLLGRQIGKITDEDACPFCGTSIPFEDYNDDVIPFNHLHFCFNCGAIFEDSLYENE